MDYVMGFLFCGGLFLFAVFMLREQKATWERKKELHVPKELPLKDDCIEASRQLISFLSERTWDIYHDLMKPIHEGTETSFCGLRDSHDIPDLIRIAHMVGYDIVLVQKGDKDIENPEMTKEKLEKYHVDLIVARRKRLERYYTRR